MGGAGAPVDVETGQKTQTWLAGSDYPAAQVSGRYWHHEPAGEAADPGFQDKLIDKLGDMTDVAIPES